MKFLGLVQNNEDLTNKIAVTQIVEEQGGKIDTISVDGVQQAIVNKNVNIDLSGKADKTAVPEKEIANANGKAQIINESDGGGVFFIRNDNTRKSFVGVNDSTAGGPDAQIYAIDPSNSNFGAKVDILKDGIYYTVGSDPYTSRIVDSNKLAVKGDVDAIDYQIKKLDTAETGYLATYQLIDKDGNVKGASINIAKDLVISSAELKTCTQDDVPVVGYRVGDKYIDFTINTLSGATHIYLNVKELVDVYKADESTLTLDASTNTFSIKQAYTDAIENKITVVDNKVIQEKADRETAVAGKLDKMPGDEYTQGNAYNLPYYFYTVPAADKVEVHTKTVTLDGNKTQGDYSLDVNSATVSQAGLMSAADKNKLDGLVIPTNVSAFNNDVGYLTAHQDISGKADKPLEPVAGQGVNVPYYFDVVYAADRATVRDYTVDLLNNSKAPQQFSLDINPATTATAGLMSAEDKNKLATAYTHANTSGNPHELTMEALLKSEAQANAVNSGITANKVATYDAYATDKQDVINDLETIRSGAALGATAIQSHQSLADYSTTAQMNTAISTATADMATQTYVTNAIGNHASLSTHITAEERTAWNAKATVDLIPTDLSELIDDSTHRVVTDAEKTAWNAKDVTPSTINVTNAVGTYKAGDTIPAGTSLFTIIQNLLTAAE